MGIHGYPTDTLGTHDGIRGGRGTTSACRIFVSTLFMASEVLWSTHGDRAALPARFLEQPLHSSVFLGSHLRCPVRPLGVSRPLLWEFAGTFGVPLQLYSGSRV